MTYTLYSTVFHSFFANSFHIFLCIFKVECELFQIKHKNYSLSLKRDSLTIIKFLKIYGTKTVAMARCIRLKTVCNESQGGSGRWYTFGIGLGLWRPMFFCLLILLSSLISMFSVSAKLSTICTQCLYEQAKRGEMFVSLERKNLQKN